MNPINQAAEAGTAQSSAPLTGQQIQSYLSPYLSTVLGSTEAIQNQENQQAQAGQLGDAIRSGAFGGDRTGIAAANLQQQQNLANSNVIANIANQGYQSALGTAQGQQQIGLAGAQQLAGIGQIAYGEGANTSSQLAGLGAGAQSAALQGAQAQIGAGTVQQQTQQAQDTALYQQFLQEKSYPFQVAQFAANVAEGTGALSGSTTTTTQPGGFFSDERLKEDMEEIGKTFDGQPIYRYKMRGDPRDRIGLSAQQVEKKHPEAVGLAGGFKYVDYGRATEEAANRSHFYEGGVVPFRRPRFAEGGYSGGLDAVLEAQRTMYAPQGGNPQRNIPSQGTSHQLAVAQGTPQPGPSGSSKVNTIEGLGKDAYQGYKYFNKTSPTAPHGAATGLQPAGMQPSGAVSYGAGTPATATGVAQPGATTYFGPAADTGSTTYFGPAAEEAGTTTTFDAGLGAADAGAASAAPAAASGAAEGAAAEGAAGAAAGAGAGAAAGAAGGAAAGAAADAAATEAAALAAEYAASYAAMAAVAAKRGGRIKRPGLATGGDVDPYESPQGGLAIPDEEISNEKLQSPGPLVKRPTGLQMAMKGGQPDQASNNIGEIFSNQALARGGLAGRRGYDDGGMPEDTPDTPAPSSTTTEGEIPRNKPTPATDDVATGLAPSKHWWQKSENILPILSGLAAMGTEKTVHPGVALAAGLGAGAESYLHTRASQAKTAEEQQRARGLEIANQLGALKVKAAQDYFSPPKTPQTTPDAQATADGIEQMYRTKYQTMPWTPDEQTAMQKARGAAIALGNDQPVQQAQAARDQRVQNQTYANQKAAQVEADQLRDQYLDPKSTEPQRKAALVRYNAIHQWTGDQPQIEGGIVKNSRTGIPEIGTIAQQGFTPAQESEFMNMALAPTDVRNPDTGQVTTMEAWKAHGAASPRAYAQALKVNSTIPTSVSTGAPSSGGAARPVPAPTPAAAPPPNGGAGIIGASQSPVAARQQALDQEAVAHVREAGDAAPNNRNINQQLLQLSAETSTGPARATIQKLAAAVGLPSGSRYQEINAYLDRQAASQALAMGVPHTNAGLAASQSATGTAEYTPKALQEKVKYADALNSGVMAYREGLDKAVGTGGTPNLQRYQAFRSAWAKNFDPDVYRFGDAMRRSDNAELNAIKARLGPQGMKILMQKSTKLDLLESGQIPP